MHGDWQVGQIDKRPAFTRTEPRWLWALNGVPGEPKGIGIAGVNGTLDETEAELRKSWEQRLAWAGLSDVKARFQTRLRRPVRARNIGGPRRRLRFVGRGRIVVQLRAVFARPDSPSCVG